MLFCSTLKKGLWRLYCAILMEIVPQCSSSTGSVKMLNLLKSCFLLSLCQYRIITQIMILGAGKSDYILYYITFVTKNIVWRNGLKNISYTLGNVLKQIKINSGGRAFKFKWKSYIFFFFFKDAKQNISLAVLGRACGLESHVMFWKQNSACWREGEDRTFFNGTLQNAPAASCVTRKGQTSNVQQRGWYKEQNFWLIWTWEHFWDKKSLCGKGGLIGG